MKTLTILGARPQFIKASPVLKLLTNDVLVHTGQHYDKNMSDVFFDDLDIRKPDYNLDINGGSNANQVAKMLTPLCNIMIIEKPDCIIVYGDTNSTLAGALAAKMCNIKLVHIEAGLRSNNMDMSEEINRIITDKIADVLICPTLHAFNNLISEGKRDNTYFCGDTMYDLIKKNRDKFVKTYDDYYLLTLHRPVNVDNKENLNIIVSALNELDKKIIFPCHPRTMHNLIKFDIHPNVEFIEPVGYMEMMGLAANACKIITDSGGLQKEAHMLNVPCITLRDETEWVESVECGANRLTPIDKDKICFNIKTELCAIRTLPYGNGNAAKNIVDVIND